MSITVVEGTGSQTSTGVVGDLPPPVVPPRYKLDLGDGASGAYGGFVAPASGGVYKDFDAINGAQADTGRVIGVTSAVNGLEISGVNADDVARVLDVRGTGAKVDNLVMKKVRGTNLVRGFASIRGASSFGLIEDCYGRGVAPDPAPTGDTPFETGIGFADTAHDMIIRRTIMEYMRQNGSTVHYLNSDGFTAELGNYNLLFEDCLAQFNADGGFDLKALTSILRRCTAISNNRNFRFWKAISCEGELTSVRPVKHSPNQSASTCHIHVTGDNVTPPRIDIQKAVFVADDNTVPLFTIENGAAQIYMQDYDLQVPSGTLIKLGGSPGNVIDWGPKGPPPMTAQGRTI